MDFNVTDDNSNSAPAVFTASQLNNNVSMLEISRTIPMQRRPISKVIALKFVHRVRR
jgi:hypothetical protein